MIDIVEGPYLADLLEQPAALRRAMAAPLPADLIQASGQLRGESPFVILTGMGSSFHALHATAIRLAEAGIRSVMLETSELIHSYPALLHTGAALLLVVSQSGRSAEIVRLLELNAERNFVIGVTNDPTSPLAQRSNVPVFLHAGPESTVSCKTYLSTLWVLDRVSQALVTGQLPPASNEDEALATLVEDYLHRWREHVAEAVQMLQGVENIIIAARGASLSTALTGALITKEAARFPTEGMSAAAFRHGPLEMVSPRLLLLLCRGVGDVAALHDRLAAEVAQAGGRVEMLSSRPHPAVMHVAATSQAFQTILEILPIQMITLALAARQGAEAGAFLRASKITNTE